MSGQGGFLHRCQQCSMPPTRSCTLQPPRVHHREDSKPEASSEEETPDTQGERERLCNMQHGAGWSCPFRRGKVLSPPPMSSG